MYDMPLFDVTMVVVLWCEYLSKYVRERGIKIEVSFDAVSEAEVDLTEIFK